MRLSYYKNWDTGASVISAVQGGSGLPGSSADQVQCVPEGQTTPIDIPASWGLLLKLNRIPKWQNASLQVSDDTPVSAQ